jgi:hypothetical protein
VPWFVRPGDNYQVLVPEYMVDTVERCRREGWAEIPDPRTPAALSEPVIDPDPAATQARSSEQRVAAVKRTKSRNASARAWVERKH